MASSTPWWTPSRRSRSRATRPPCASSRTAPRLPMCCGCSPSPPSSTSPRPPSSSATPPQLPALPHGSSFDGSPLPPRSSSAATRRWPPPIFSSPPSLRSTRRSSSSRPSREFSPPKGFLHRRARASQVELSSGKEVADIVPDIDEIKKCSGRGVIATGPAPAGSGYDFFTRFFCPKFGIDEDPVCGSAHCFLAPYWGGKLGKQKLTAFQASPRSGILYLELEAAARRVRIQGEAVTVMTGTLLA